MMKELIGTNAGKIWQRLEAGELTDTNINKVKKDCQLSSSEFLLALGWLARENKVKFLDGNNKVYVFPNE